MDLSAPPLGRVFHLDKGVLTRRIIYCGLIVYFSKQGAQYGLPFFSRKVRSGPSPSLRWQLEHMKHAVW